jgi:tetratricopeptide (TPR) repeat protein
MATLAVLTVCGMTALSAHGDLHEQIAAASGAIARHPHDAALYLARGELYRAHHDTDPALADYATALRLDPTIDAAHLARGRLLMEANRAAEALPDLDRFLTRRPDHADSSSGPAPGLQSGTRRMRAQTTTVRSAWPRTPTGSSNGRASCGRRRDQRPPSRVSTRASPASVPS